MRRHGIETGKAEAGLIAASVALHASHSERFHDGHSALLSKAGRDDVDDVGQQPGHLQGARRVRHQLISGFIGA